MLQKKSHIDIGTQSSHSKRLTISTAGEVLPGVLSWYMDAKLQ